MAGDPLWINASAGAPSYTANELREAMALAMMYGGRNMGARAGVRPGGNQLQVSYAAPTITVQPGLCLLDPGLTTPQGPYWVAIPAAETHTLTAADATNPRKDIVIARVYDTDEDASGLRLARSEYLVGTPNPSPAEPAVPTGAIRLATLDVPASPGAAVVTDRRPWTVATGGILPVPDQAARDALSPYDGLAVWRMDLDVVEVYTGSAWLVQGPPSPGRAVRREVSSTNTFTNPTSYTVLQQTADRTALTISFTKVRASTRLILSISGALNLASGVAQNLYLGLRIAATNYDMSQFKFPTAPGHFVLSGFTEVTGLAAGTYTCEPVIKSAGAASVTMVAGEDFVSYSVSEAV